MKMKNLMTVFIAVFLISATTYSVPIYIADVFCPDDRFLGSMEINSYDTHMIEWVGGVEIDGLFRKAVNLKYGYIQSLNLYDDPTPKKYKDGTGLPVPLIDAPPGGYQSDPFDYLVYYPASVFPNFYDRPSTYMLDAKTEPDNKLQLSFETWLVCVCEETFGAYANQAKDDIYKVAPLIGWTWGYSITYVDNGNGIDDLADFKVTKEEFAWQYPNPSNNWITALGQKYGIAPNQDWFNVTLCDCEKCIPEPATLLLLGMGGLALLRRRRR